MHLLLSLSLLLSPFHNTEIENELFTEGFVKREGNIADLRTPFVNFQAEMEQKLVDLLEEGEIQFLEGIIHTPTPPTPFCKKPEEKNVHETVAARTVTCRRLLDAGGILYAVYPPNGIEGRTEEEILCYTQELTNYPLKEHLLTHLTRETFPTECIGATYFFKTKQNELYAFSIAMAQINTELETLSAKLWFGPIIENTPIQKRTDQILNFINENSERKLRLLSFEKNEVSE